jgi:hypothetical protein
LGAFFVCPCPLARDLCEETHSFCVVPPQQCHTSSGSFAGPLAPQCTTLAAHPPTHKRRRIWWLMGRPPTARSSSHAVGPTFAPAPSPPLALVAPPSRPHPPRCSAPPPTAATTTAGHRTGPTTAPDRHRRRGGDMQSCSCQLYCGRSARRADPAADPGPAAVWRTVVCERGATHAPRLTEPTHARRPVLPWARAPLALRPSARRMPPRSPRARTSLQSSGPTSGW